MENPAILAVYVVTQFAVMVLVFVVVRRVRAARIEKLRQTLTPDAARRGWTVTVEQRRSDRVIVWKGESDNVRWVAEAIKGAQSAKYKRASLTRWRSENVRGPAGAILFMGLPDKDVLKTPAADQGMIAALAMKAVMLALDKGIDVFFGKDAGADIDAAKLKRVEQVEPPIPHLTVMAENPSDASRRIFQGIGQAINASMKDEGQGAATGDDGLLSVLIWRKGVTIGRFGDAGSAAEIEPVVRAGVAISNAVMRT